MAQKDLNNAKNSKKDEFYTQFPDIERELKHYKKYFKDKVVQFNARINKLFVNLSLLFVIM